MRPYRPGDAEALTEIFVRAVTETGLRGYSPEQVAAWAASGGTLQITEERCGDGRLVLVAVTDDDVPMAFIDLEADGHLDMMFCLPEWTGKGVASALYDQLETEAKARGLHRMYVEASEIAKPFFLHKSFALLHRNDFTLDGIAIHNYAMEKNLTGGLGKGAAPL